MLARVLYAATGHLRGKIISGSNRGEPYLERYYLGRCLGRHFYLHRFIGGDVAEETHNHPWQSSMALVLSGGYREEIDRLLANGRKKRVERYRGAGRINRIKADTLHRIVYARPETWTLFWHTEQRVQHWGFLVPDEKGGWEIEPHQSRMGEAWYLKAPKGKELGREPFIWPWKGWAADSSDNRTG